MISVAVIKTLEVLGLQVPNIETVDNNVACDIQAKAAALASKFYLEASGDASAETQKQVFLFNYRLDGEAQRLAIILDQIQNPPPLEEAIRILATLIASGVGQ